MVVVHVFGFSHVSSQRPLCYCGVLAIANGEHRLYRELVVIFSSDEFQLI